MSSRTELLNRRLEEIGHRWKRNLMPGSAGIGLGGLEVDRLDDFSDLDFFVLVEPGFKQHFFTDLSWLSSICPIAYSFANTSDGYKLLFADGVFCEFAIFEPQELENATYSPGRVIWKRPQVSDSIAIPKRTNPSPWLAIQPG
jgi:hypothetical protein